MALSIVAAFLVATPPASGPQMTKRTSQWTDRSQGQNAYAKLPITFVENRGQTNQDVRYFARGPHYAFFLKPNEVVLSLMKPSPKLTHVNQSGRGVGGRYLSGTTVPRSQSGGHRERGGARAGKCELPSRQQSGRLAHRSFQLYADRLPRPMERSGFETP